MTDSPRKRRWLQYSLRGLLLVMLLCAMWLGYEVHDSHRQQHAVAAIERVGGRVTGSDRRFSLLALCGLDEYGTRVTRVAIPGGQGEAALPALKQLEALEGVALEYDGTRDLYPEVEEMQSALDSIAIEPKGLANPWRQWPEDEHDNRFGELRKRARLIDKLRAVGKWQLVDEVRSDLAAHPFLNDSSPAYDVVPVRSGEYAEVHRFEFCSGNIPGNATALLVILIRDRVIGFEDAYPSAFYRAEVRIEDLDADGWKDVAIERTVDVTLNPPAERRWLGAWSITPDGLVPIKPEEWVDEALNPFSASASGDGKTK